MTYAPEGAVFPGQNGGSAFTHGVQIGVAGKGSGNLQRDTDALLQSFARTNPQLRRSGGYSRVSVDGRQGLATNLVNVSVAFLTPSYSTDSNEGGGYTGHDGEVFGHKPSDAFDSNLSTYWLSIGNRNATADYAFEYIQGGMSGTISAVNTAPFA